MHRFVEKPSSTYGQDLFSANKIHTQYTEPCTTLDYTGADTST